MHIAAVVAVKLTPDDQSKCPFWIEAISSIKAPTGKSVKGRHRKRRDERWTELRIRKEVVEFSLSGLDFASQLASLASGGNARVVRVVLQARYTGT